MTSGRTWNRATVLTIATLLLCCAVSSAAVPVADRAGVWSLHAVESTVTNASGVKTGIDLGPARAAALGHLDSDGVVDLVVAHGTQTEAWAVVTLGDPRFRLGAKHDRMRELDGLLPERAFASESVVYPLPFAPDWAAVGDWDADGDFDVVFAARGLDRLYWLTGDGQGVLGDGRDVRLAGGVTAFVSREVNRRDGLDDIVIAVSGENGSKLLVFENPRGAMSCDPEVVPMSEPVADIAVDWLDDDGWRDIAVAAGDTVVVVSGRDRRLSLAREKREAVLAAEKVSLEFDQRVTGLTAGDFIGRDRRTQLAVRLDDGTVTLVRRVDEAYQRTTLGTVPPAGRMTSTRSSGLPGHDLVVHGTSAGGIELFHVGEPKTTRPRLEPVTVPVGDVSAIAVARLNLDTRDDFVLLREDGSVEVAASKNRVSLVVNSTTDTDDGTCDAGHCSLREAINEANVLPAGSVITFDLGLGATIQPVNELPALTQPAATVIDGTVGTGLFTGLLRLQGDLAGTGAKGIVISGGQATISNFLIGGFDSFGIHLQSDDNLVTRCRIGLDETGGMADPNSYGIVIGEFADNTIGGTASGEGNVISGNTSRGVYDNGGTGSVITGNTIGLTLSGNTALPNAKGISSEDAEGFAIGLAVPGGGNVISGNLVDGLDIEGDSDPFGVPAFVLGNTIGLDPFGSIEIPNGGDGIQAEGSYSLTIGGPTPLAGNVISGNSQDGIDLLAGSVDVLVQGNTIGSDPSGTMEMGNANGIGLGAAEESTIGGTVAGSGNLISGNRGSGLFSPASSVAHHIDILGNILGPGIDGSNMESDEGVFLNGGQIITIGSVESPNTVAQNRYGGIVISNNCTGVTIGPNSIHSNAASSGSLGIDLGGDGVTPNDPLDADTGPNGLQNFPEIEFVNPVNGDVDFYVRSTPNASFVVDFYENPSCSSSGYGEGRTYLGSMTVITEANGEASDQVTLGPLTGGAVVTATATGGFGTSEFSECFDIPYPPGHIFSDGFESGDTTLWTGSVN